MRPVARSTASTMVWREQEPRNEKKKKKLKQERTWHDETLKWRFVGYDRIREDERARGYFGDVGCRG